MRVVAGSPVRRRGDALGVRPGPGGRLFLGLAARPGDDEVGDARRVRVRHGNGRSPDRSPLGSLDTGAATSLGTLGTRAGRDDESLPSLLFPLLNWVAVGFPFAVDVVRAVLRRRGRGLARFPRGRVRSGGVDTRAVEGGDRDVALHGVGGSIGDWRGGLSRTDSTRYARSRR